MATIHFQIYFDVDDVRAFVRAARERARSEDCGIGDSELLRTYSARNLDACAVMMLDPGWLPGCSIHDSTAEVQS